MISIVGTNPIDQFLIIGSYCQVISNYSLTIFISTISLFLIFVVIFYSIEYTQLYRAFKNYVSISSETLAPITGYNYYLFTVFTLICLFNLFGIIPYSLTLTSLALTTLYFGMQSFCGLNVIAFAIQNSKLANLFLPTGSPLAMSWFLIILELISYNVRVLSLSIRLFANMLAGHALAKILGSFVWSIIGIGFFGFLGIAPFLTLFIISFLELLICLLQGYVFSVLVSLYINDVIKSH